MNMSVDAAKVAEKYEKNGEEGLNDEEKRFLQDRGVTLSTPVPVTFKLPGGGTVTNDPLAYLANVQEQRGVDIEAEVQRRVEIQLARLLAESGQAVQHEQIVAQTEHTGTANPTRHPTGGQINPNPEDLEDDDEDDDGEEDDGEEDYDEGWTNDTRRAELTNRGLSTDGNKDELIARLRESDQNDNE